MPGVVAYRFDAPDIVLRGLLGRVIAVTAEEVHRGEGDQRCSTLTRACQRGVLRYEEGHRSTIISARPHAYA